MTICTRNLNPRKPSAKSLESPSSGLSAWWLLTQPIVMLIAVYMAYLFGLFYRVFSMFPGFWKEVYHARVGIEGLNFVASVLISIVRFWNGWSAEAKMHWIMPNAGITIFATGSILCLRSMQTYIIDTYTRFAVSGIATAVLLRSLAGFGFLLFAPYMYDTIGYGWGNSVLGFFGIVVGNPAPFIFWKHWGKLRSKSRYAAGLERATLTLWKLTM